MNAPKEKALPVNGRIVSIRQSMIEGSTSHQIVHIEFEILGAKPYRANATWFVQVLHLSKIQEGNVISILVNPEFPYKIYPFDSWATYSEGYEKL